RLALFVPCQSSKHAVEACLGIDEELTGRHDLLAFLEARQDLRSLAQLCTSADLRRAETRIVLHDNDRSCAGIEHCLARNGQRSAIGRPDTDPREHAGSKHVALVRDDDAHSSCTRLLVEPRIDEIDFAGDDLAGSALETRLDEIAWLNATRVPFRDLRNQPE